MSGCPSTAPGYLMAVFRFAFEELEKKIIIGWVIELAGVALWLYGYFVAGHPPLVNWHDKTPSEPRV